MINFLETEIKYSLYINYLIIISKLHSISMDTIFLISQILVIFAIITDYVSFQFKDRKKILLILSISSFLIAIHYLLLDKLNAFFFEVLVLSAFLVSAYTSNKKILGIFLVLFLFPLIFNYTGRIDLIIFLGVYISLIAKFQSNDKAIRIQTMIGTLFVILYNAIIFSPVGVLAELLYLASNCVGYYKFYIKKKK